MKAEENRKKGVHAMEEKLNEVLLDGEKIRWSGRPAPFKLLATPSRRSLILTWAICSGALALILGALVPFYIRAQRTMVDLLVLLVITAFLPVMISIRPLLDKRCLERSTIYAITNYRVLALVNGELMFIPISRQLSHAIENRDGEAGNLCFCEAVGRKTRKTLDYAVMGVDRVSSTQSSVPGLMFFHIPHPESLLGYLS